MTDRQTEYQLYLKSDHWRALRQTVLERDSHRCRFCGSGQNLQVHHTPYRQRFEDSEPADLITLCQRCHKKEHGLLPKRIKKPSQSTDQMLSECEQIVRLGRKMPKRLRKRLKWAMKCGNPQIEERALAIAGMQWGYKETRPKKKRTKQPPHRFTPMPNSGERCVCGLYRGAHKYF